MAYVPITQLPDAPSRQDPTNFATEADAFLGALPAFGTQTNTAGAYFDSQTGIAETQATIATEAAGTASAAATAATAASSATVWVSGTDYVPGDGVYSPITFFTYRSRSTFNSIVDPSVDNTNWVLIGAGSANLFSTNNITATFDGQTDFAANYTVGAVIVSFFGSILQDTVDYTATNGTTIVLTQAAFTGDVVSVISFPTFSVADTLPLSGGTVTGPFGAASANFTGAVTTNSLSATTSLSGASLAVDGGSVSGEFIATSYNEQAVTLTAGGTVDIDSETGNVFGLTTNQSTTFTFSNPPATGIAYGFMLHLTAGGTHTITYPASVEFSEGTAPDAPSTGNTNVLVFSTSDGGNTWYGFQAGLDMS